VKDACAQVSAFTQWLNLASYLANDLVRSAVERQLSIIGEALSQLARLDPALASRIPDHRQIIAFRNVLIHGYAAMNPQRVWHEAVQSLPALAAAVGLLLAESDPLEDTAP
jgi:uncharacterized protein with HEPN domain